MEKKLSTGRVIGYGLGSMGKDLALGVIGSYLLVFYTDILGIGAVAAGLILTLTKIWDAVNDPMMGAIADRSPKTKFGKYRPYVLFVPIPLAVLSALCFVTPNFSTGGKIAFAAITYTITGMLFTAYDVPLWGMMPSLSSKMNDRNRLMASARTFTTLAMLIASAAAMPAIYALGGGQEAENLKVGYPLFMAILGVVGIVCALITFFSTKEVVDDNRENAPKENLFKQFFSIMNKPLLLCLLIMVFNAMCMILPSLVGVYYMIYYVGRADMISVYMMVSMGMGLITSIITPSLLKKTTAKNLTIGAFTADILVGILVFILGHASLAILLPLFGICGLATGILMVTITSMLTETADYIASTKGHRVDGVVFSMNSFAIKLGQAIAGGVVSAILAVTGYVAYADQSEAALTGILASRSLLPAVIGVFGLLLTLAWKLPAKERSAK